MEWYEIIGLIVLWFIGLYLKGRFYEWMKYRHFNDSWKNRTKK